MSYCIYIHAAICQSGCFHGECVAPDNCTCDLGWTGFTCNTGNSQNVIVSISLQWSDCLKLPCQGAKDSQFFIVSCINKYSKIRPRIFKAKNPGVNLSSEPYMCINLLHCPMLLAVPKTPTWLYLCTCMYCVFAVSCCSIL